jgi:hypothetical protein
MATYYKYAERSADSQVNWAQVGKGISDMLTEGAKVREEKKAAYEEAYRIDTERLVNAPQGTWQDGNATVNNFAHDMMAQQLIDYRLLKSGVMNERDYTLRRENYKSGTNTVFDLQKILQTERAATIEAFQKGELQAMNISNMADVEAYTDFSNSKIEIDPYNPNINMSIYETKIIDGKEVKVIKNTSPVNVLKGQLLQKIPAFKLDERVNKDVESLGVDVDYIYQAANTMRAGSITKLIGYGAIAGEYEKKDKNGKPLYPEFADSINKFNNAIEETINGYFANPYNLSSVLTENTGKYSSESYTVYKEEAAKDKTKLLKKLDPMTGLYVLDKEAPHYKEQEQEAREYVKKLILGKLDGKRELATTAQTQAQFAPESVTKGRAEAAQAEAAAGYWNQLYTGKTAAEKKAAANTLLGTPIAQQAGLLGIDLTENGKIKLTYADPIKNRTIDYLDTSGNPINLRDFSGLGVELHGVVDRDKAVKAGGGGTGFGKVDDLATVTSQRQGVTPQAASVSVPLSAITEESSKASTNLQSALPSGFTVNDLGGAFGNDVEIVAPDKKTKYKYTAKKGAVAAEVIKKDIEAFVKNNTSVTAEGEGELD